MTDWMRPDEVGHELRGARPDVHVDVGGALFVLASGQVEQAGNVVRVEQLFRRGHGVVDRLADDRQSGNGHGVVLLLAP